MGIGRLIVGMHLCLGFPEKVLGRQLDPPAGRHLPLRRTRPGRDHAVAPREAGEAETGGVLAAHQRVVPAVLAEAEQHGGIGNAGPVVGNGDGERRLARPVGDRGRLRCGRGKGDAHPRGVGAT